MPLPSFTVTGDLFNILGTVAASELTADTLVGTVTFTPNVSSSEFVKWGGDLYRVSPVTARMSAVGLTYNGGPVKLLANDAGLSVTGLQWHVEIAVKPDPGTGITRAMKDFWFNAPADGAAVDLAAVAPVVNASAQGVTFTEAQLVTLLGDATSGVREALDALYEATAVSWSSLTGKPAVIAAGADQAAARSSIGALDSAAVSALITTAVNNLLNGAPGALDTLKELADAIGDDANFAATMTTALSGKQNSRTIVPVSSSVTLGAAARTDYVALIGAGGAPTLPTAVGNTNRYTLKNVDTTNKTLATTSSQTVDGSVTVTLTPNTSLDVVSDNSNWVII